MLHNKPKAAAVYIRTATDNADAVQNQKEMLYVYSKDHGYDDLRTYIDCGHTGNKINRPALNVLTNDINDGIVNTVIVKDLSRISRSILDTILWVDSIYSKAMVISVQDNLNVNDFRKYLKYK